MAADRTPDLQDVLRSAARLQQIVPDAVLVGGSAAAYHAGHRLSLDHGHVIADLDDRFETILDHLESLDVDGSSLRVPTIEETLRIKAWLALTRNQTRDHLDIAALCDRLGEDESARVLLTIDEYYADLYEGDDRVATQVARQLADPRPRDEAVTRQLDRYRQLDARWHDWNVVVAVCRGVAARMLEVPS